MRANEPQVVRLSTSTTRKSTDRSQCFFVVGRGGFEPPKSLTSDLQSDPFGRSGIFPFIFSYAKSDWSRRRELNLQPADYKSAALPIELHRRIPEGDLLGLPKKIVKQDFLGKGGAGVISVAGAEGSRPQKASRADMVPWGGIEPPTYGFSVHRSPI